MNVAQHTVSPKQTDGCIIKGVTPKSALPRLKQEFELEQLLFLYHLTPRVWDWDGTHFKETWSTGTPASTSDQHIASIAKVLRTLHTVSLTKLALSLAHSLHDRFAQPDQYHFDSLCQLALAKLAKNYSVAKFKQFTYQARRYEKIINSVSYELSIIHGDLHSSNILINEHNEVCLIDWLDTRIDLPTHDIAQYFYLNRLDSRQQLLFWRHYGKIDWMVPEIIDCHLFTLSLFEQITVTK